MKTFIVYAFHEPDKVCDYHGSKCPFYIGKGLPCRPAEHFRARQLALQTHFYHKLNFLLSKGIQPVIRIIAADLTEQEAFDIEIKLITLYGREDNGSGCLTNHTAGGEGRFGGTGSLGFQHSLDSRILMSKPMPKDRKIKLRASADKISVECFDSTGKTVQQFESITSVREFGYTPSIVQRVLSGERKSHSHLGWRYA